MRTYNIRFHDEIIKCPEIFGFLSHWKNFLGFKKEFELATLMELSLFESLKFYCIYMEK